MHIHSIKLPTELNSQKPNIISIPSAISYNGYFSGNITPARAWPFRGKISFQRQPDRPPITFLTATCLRFTPGREHDKTVAERAVKDDLWDKTRQ